MFEKILLVILVIMIAVFTWTAIRPVFFDSRTMQTIGKTLNAHEQRIAQNNNRIASLNTTIGLLEKDIRELKTEGGEDGL